MLSIAVFAVIAAAAPAPTQPPLIARSKSSPFCTAIRERIGPAIAGLAANDRIITAGTGTVMKMAHDYAAAGAASRNDTVHTSPAMRIDASRMSQLAQNMVHNLHVVDQILADKRFKEHATDDDKQLGAMKAALLRVKQAQEAGVNILNGTADTLSLESLMNDGNSFMSGGLGANLANKTRAQVFGSGSLLSPSFRDQLTNKADSFVLNSPVGHIYKLLLLDQAISNRAGRKAAALIVPSAQSCR